jgi:ribosomal protein L37AE/L43A
VNGAVYRRNFDAIFSRPYPDWICAECGRKHGKRPEGNPYGATWHIDECGICGTGGVEVTEPRDFGHLREGWDE